jgi:hypothetical protein
MGVHGHLVTIDRRGDAISSSFVQVKRMNCRHGCQVKLRLGNGARNISDSVVARSGVLQVDEQARSGASAVAPVLVEDSHVDTDRLGNSWLCDSRAGGKRGVEGLCGKGDGADVRGRGSRLLRLRASVGNTGRTSGCTIGGTLEASKVDEAAHHCRHVLALVV